LPESAIEKFRAELESFGIYPTEIIPDGQLHRCSAREGDPQDEAGWYVLHNDGKNLYAGAFGSWRSDVWETWCSKQKLTDAEKRKHKRYIAQAKERFREAKAERRAQAVEKAKGILSKAQAAENHPYLANKQIKSFGLKISKRGDLLIPVQDLQGRLFGLQIINTEGDKKFITGSDISGHCYKIPGDKQLIICEGYATGASIHEATGATVFCAFNANNLKPVAAAIRKAYPNQKITIAADNDQFTGADPLHGAPENPGKTKGEEAARWHVCFLTWPEFEESDLADKPTDFNDLHVRYGLESVAAAIRSAVPIKAAIELEDGKFIELTQKVERALLLKKADIYQRGSSLVRPIMTQAGTYSELRRKARTPLLFEVDTAYFRGLCAEHCRFLKKDKDGNHFEQNPPKFVGETYLARAGEWNVRPLVSITESPTFRPDGSIINKPGYDPDTYLLYWPNDKFLPIKDKPTKDEARAALDVLLDLTSSFPFVDKADRSVALAGILTPLVRRAVPIVPMFGFSAPTPRTGKSLLVDVCSMISTGKRIPTLSQGSTEEELDKRLDAAIYRGDTMLNLDNCERPIRSERLCQLCTQEGVITRILGQTKNLSLPSMMTLYATGNNLAFAGDMTARALLCRLDARVERPEERHFDRDLFEYIPDNRPKIIHAAMTIIRAWLSSGEKPDIRLSDFTKWDHWIRNALLWMDQADPLETREIVRESDVNFQNMRTLFHIWFETFKTQKVTVRDISEAAEHNQELYDALFAVAGRKGKFDQPYLGYWLRKHRNKIMDEIQLIEAGRNRTNTTQWQMVSLNSQGPVRENVLKLQDVKSNPESTGKVKNDIETI
jgi:phage/plasmid primase-like uncharacterized protein